MYPYLDYITNKFRNFHKILGVKYILLAKINKSSILDYLIQNNGYRSGLASNISLK